MSTGDIQAAIPSVDLTRPGDLALIRTAIRNEYPITDDVRKLIVNQMALIVGRDDSAKMRVAAARVLVAADSVNVKREAIQQADEHKRMPDKHLHLHAETQAKVVIHLPDNGR